MVQAETANDLVGAVDFFDGAVRACDRILEWIVTIAGSQNSPAQMGDPFDPVAGQRNQTSVWIFLGQQQPVKTV